MERLPQHSLHLGLALRPLALALSPPWALAPLPPPRRSALPRRPQIPSAPPPSRSLRLVLRQARAACSVRLALLEYFDRRPALGKAVLLFHGTTMCSPPLFFPTTSGGAPQQQTPALGGGLFGAQSAAAPATGGLFGAQQAPAGGGLFGNASAAPKPMFGAATTTPGQAFGATPSGGFGLGASSQRV